MLPRLWATVQNEISVVFRRRKCILSCNKETRPHEMFQCFKELLETFPSHRFRTTWQEPGGQPPSWPCFCSSLLLRKLYLPSTRPAPDVILFASTGIYPCHCCLQTRAQANRGQGENWRKPCNHYRTHLRGFTRLQTWQPLKASGQTAQWWLSEGDWPAGSCDSWVDWWLCSAEYKGRHCMGDVSPFSSTGIHVSRVSVFQS